MSNTLPKVTVVLLAGDRGAGDPVAVAAGVERKVLAPVAGRTMLARTLDLFRGGGFAEKILVVANKSFELKENAEVHEAAEGGDVTFMEGAGSPVQSVLKVLGEYSGLYPVLLATADNPLLRPGSLKEFLETAMATPGDVVAALVTRRTVESEFPNPGRTFVALRGDAYTGCNLFLLKSPEALKVIEFWLEIERNRKKALRFVAAFGFGALFGVLFRLIDIHGAARRVSRAVGANVDVIVLDDAGAAMDVDKPAHLEFANDVLSGKEATG